MTMLLRSRWSRYRPRVLYTLNPSGLALVRAACSRSRRDGSPVSLGKKLPAMVSHIGTGGAHLEGPLRVFVPPPKYPGRNRPRTRTELQGEWSQGQYPRCSEPANPCFDPK